MEVDPGDPRLVNTAMVYRGGAFYRSCGILADKYKWPAQAHAMDTSIATLSLGWKDEKDETPVPERLGEKVPNLQPIYLDVLMSRRVQQSAWRCFRSFRSSWTACIHEVPKLRR